MSEWMKEMLSSQGNLVVHLNRFIRNRNELVVHYAPIQHDTLSMLLQLLVSSSLGQRGLYPNVHLPGLLDSW